jgi:hypothetical protein
MSHSITVSGTVTDGSGRPVRDVEVLVVDADTGLDDALGIDTTTPDGRFEVTATRDDVGGVVEGDPELVVHLFDDGRHVDANPVGGNTTGISLTVERDRVGLDPMAMMEAAQSMHHGMGGQRGVENVPVGPSAPGHGRFQRMFPHLTPADHDVAFLQELGLPGGPLDESAAGSVDDGPLPSGFVFLGQFIDHDITLDPLSSLTRQNDPDALRNFRTPGLDLDSVYGAGPEADPFRYESPFVGGDNHYLLLADADRIDLPRNHHDTALIGDPRNDENLIVSQLHYAMLNFHNAVVDWLGDVPDLFEKAQTVVRRHYHWIVLHEYLPAVCDSDIVERVRDEGDRRFFTVEVDEPAYIPLEFSGAAYRFGHSQARLDYRVNAGFEGPLFGMPGDTDALGTGFQAVPEHKAVNWRYLFDFDGSGVDPQPVRAIDPRLAPDLLALPFVMDAEPWRKSLASRNLVRGRQLGLPSGQAVARNVGDVPVVSNDDVGFDAILSDHGQDEDTEMPLWYYVLAEAAHLTGGDHLGPVGSRIVAETLVGLIDSDPSSYRTVHPGWTPTLPGPHSGSDDFQMADLLEFAVDGGYTHPTQ